MARSVLIPMGMSYKVSEAEGGTGWIWELKRFSRLVAQGIATTEKLANKAVSDKILEYSGIMAATSDQKREARHAIKELAIKRPYLVQHVLGSLLAGGILKDVLEQAEEQELEIFHSEPKRLAVPITTHHRALTPRQAAEKLVKCLRVLGLFGEDTPSPKLAGWAKRMGLTRQQEIVING